jgi:hypothetical protein
MILAALLTTFAFSADARAEGFVSRYVVSLDGLRVGDAILRTSFDAKHYKVAVSADVGTLLASTQIQAEAVGARSGAKLTPEHFQMELSGSDRGAVAVNFANSAAAAEDGAPRLRGVFDPLSALLAASIRPTSSSKHPCNAVMPIFTGHDRFDLNLRPKPVEVAENEPAVTLCQAVATPPQAGLRDLDGEIAFTKVAKSHFWLVERISFSTPKGVVTMERAETSISGS